MPVRALQSCCRSFGLRIAVVGGSPELGDWDPSILPAQPLFPIPMPPTSSHSMPLVFAPQRAQGACGPEPLITKLLESQGKAIRLETSATAFPIWVVPLRFGLESVTKHRGADRAETRACCYTHTHMPCVQPTEPTTEQSPKCGRSGCSGAGGKELSGDLYWTFLQQDVRCVGSLADASPSVARPSLAASSSS